MSEPGYWDRRAEGAFAYRGETFYTVTPISYYVARRAWLIARLREEFDALPQPPARILDFGCGDGYFTKLAAHRFPDAKIVGYDPSSGMMQIDGKSANEPTAIRFTASRTDVLANGPYDLILCVAVLAHIEDARIDGEIAFWNEVSVADAAALCFEQVGDPATSGVTWTRRSEQGYIELMRRNGWRVERAGSYRRRLLDTSSRIVQRGFGGLRKLVRHAGVGLEPNANSYRSVRFLFHLLEHVTRWPDRRLPAARRNTLFVLRRAS